MSEEGITTNAALRLIENDRKGVSIDADWTRKQKRTSTSTAEAEFTALNDAVRDTFELRAFKQDI